VADVTPDNIRGRAFGFHRAADTAGAVIGPLIGRSALLATLNERFRIVFLIAGITTVLQLVRLDREPATTRLIRRVFLCLVCEENFDAPAGQQVEHRCPTSKPELIR
jgi:MFS family permease